jgi:hypothetical protein
MEPNNFDRFEDLMLFFKGMQQVMIEQWNEGYSKKEKSDPYESEDTKEIATALAKAQGEYPRINCNRENPYFKSNFADLDSIMGYVRPILSRNGLSFTQQTIISPEGATILHSRVRHATGQWIESRTRIIPPKNDQQSYSSTLTYMRRHSALALLNITVSSDMGDDDAEVAMEDARIQVVKGPSEKKYTPRQTSTELVSKDNIEEISMALKEHKDLLQEVYKQLDVNSIADIKKDDYAKTVNWIRKSVRYRETGRYE